MLLLWSAIALAEPVEGVQVVFVEHTRDGGVRESKLSPGESHMSEVRDGDDLIERYHVALSPWNGDGWILTYEWCDPPADVGQECGQSTTVVPASYAGLEWRLEATRETILPEPPPKRTKR